MGVDDIMIKIKAAENKDAGHYLSPLSRFVLEPRGGYDDNDRFGVVYNKLYSPEELDKVRAQACRN